MGNKQYKKYEKVEHPKPQRKVKLEVYDDGMYVGTISTEWNYNQEHPVDEENILEYVYKKFPTRKKKYLTVKLV